MKESMEPIFSNNRLATKKNPSMNEKNLNSWMVGSILPFFIDQKSETTNFVSRAPTKAETGNNPQQSNCHNKSFFKQKHQKPCMGKTGGISPSFTGRNRENKVAIIEFSKNRKEPNFQQSIKKINNRIAIKNPTFEQKTSKTLRGQNGQHFALPYWPKS